MNIDMEKAYLDLLAYAGLESKEGAITILGEDEVLTTEEDKNQFYLPYNSILKNPLGKQPFHILNENYLIPEGESFLRYKDTLTGEINIKLVVLMEMLIDVSCNAPLQKSIKTKKLVNFLMAISGSDNPDKSDFDPGMGETLRTRVFSKARAEGDSHGPFVNFFIRRKGVVDGEEFGVTCRSNFSLYTEIKKAFETREWKLFGHTLRKKDIIAYNNLLNAIFPEMDNVDKYSSGVDNDVFGYLHALLTTTYIITKRINDIFSMLMKDLGSSYDHIKELMFDLSWIGSIEKMLSLTSIIRFVPNQDDIKADTNRTNKLKMDTSMVPKGHQTPMQQPQVQQPQQPQAPMQPTYQPNQTVAPNQAPQLTLEQRMAMGVFNNNNNMLQQNQMYQPTQQQMMMLQQQQQQQQMQMQQQQQMPSWMHNMTNPQQQQQPQQQGWMGYNNMGQMNNMGQGFGNNGVPYYTDNFGNVIQVDPITGMPMNNMNGVGNGGWG